MSSQPLFFAPTEHVKVAGYKLPSNPRFWQSEIIRYLASQHPYLQLADSEIDIRRMDAAKGAAVGSVVLGSQIAIPIIINRPRPGADPELAPMDVFFHKGRYRFLEPETIKNVIHTPQVGEPEKKPSQALGGNPYIGDVTGDATPLEYSGQASPFAGPYDGAKVSCDLSTYLLPDYLRKEAGSGEKAKERAILFGTTGGIGGGVTGAIRTKGGPGARAVGALSGTAIGALAGAAAGAGSVPVIKALGLSKKEKRQQREAIKRIVKNEIEKSSALDFSAGIDDVTENGLLSGLIKNAYIDPNDISNFRRLLATNPAIIPGAGGNLKLVEVIARRGPYTTMSSGSLVKAPNMVQIYQRDGAVYIKFSGGPESKTDKDELKKIVGDRLPEVMSKLRSGGVFMEHDGVQEVSWDVKRPLGEARSITSDGLYAVRTQRGENLVGMVCQAVMDIDGKTLPLKLFVSPEGKYSLVGEMFGVRLAGKHRLPSQVPSAGQSGVFVNYVHGTPISTLPMRLISVRRVKPDEGDERVLYLMQNPMTGDRFTLSPVRGIQGFERMRVVDPGVKALSEGTNVYYMPADSEWVTFKNPVRLAETAEELQKLSSIEEETHVTYSGGHWNVEATLAKEAVAVRGFLGTGLHQAKQLFKNPGRYGQSISRSYGIHSKRYGGLGGALQTAKQYAPGAAVLGGGAYGAYRLGGALTGGGPQPQPQTPKIQYAKFSSYNLDEPGAREVLVSMGMTPDDAERVMDTARAHDGMDRGIKIAGLHEPQIRGEEIDYVPEREYDQATIDFAAGCRPGPELIKAAAESQHPETLDALLSLEFITPQNLKYFIDSIPDFDEAATRLAALLVAVRLGMPNVPEQPVKDALEGLSKTINKLQVLKSAVEHKNGRASTSM